jgi:hypothetical protein
MQQLKMIPSASRPSRMTANFPVSVVLHEFLKTIQTFLIALSDTFPGSCETEKASRDAQHWGSLNPNVKRRQK